MELINTLKQLDQDFMELVKTKGIRYKIEFYHELIYKKLEVAKKFECNWRVEMYQKIINDFNN